MSAPQQSGAIATKADWTMVEAVYDVFEPLLSRKPAVAAAMAAEMHEIAVRYKAHLTPQRVVGTPAEDPR